MEAKGAFEHTISGREAADGSEGELHVRQRGAIEADRIATHQPIMNEKTKKVDVAKPDIGETYDALICG